MITVMLKYFRIRQEDRSELAVIVIATAAPIFAFHQRHGLFQQAERHAVSIDGIPLSEQSWRTKINFFQKLWW